MDRPFVFYAAGACLFSLYLKDSFVVMQYRFGGRGRLGLPPLFIYSEMASPPDDLDATSRPENVRHEFLKTRMGWKLTVKRQKSQRNTKKHNSIRGFQNLMYFLSTEHCAFANEPYRKFAKGICGCTAITTASRAVPGFRI